MGRESHVEAGDREGLELALFRIADHTLYSERHCSSTFASIGKKQPGTWGVRLLWAKLSVHEKNCGEIEVIRRSPPFPAVSSSPIFWDGTVVFEPTQIDRGNTVGFGVNTLEKDSQNDGRIHGG